jgi:hypothetical protein
MERNDRDADPEMESIIDVLNEIPQDN